MCIILELKKVLRVHSIPSFLGTLGLDAVHKSEMPWNFTNGAGLLLCNFFIPAFFFPFSLTMKLPVTVTYKRLTWASPYTYGITNL